MSKQKLSTNQQKLAEIINNVEDATPKLFKTYLENAYEIILYDDYFLDLFDYILCCKRSIPHKINKFIVNIFEKLNKEQNDKLDIILKYLTQFIASKSISGRKHALNIIGSIINIKNNKIDTELLEKIYERIFDKEQSVRNEAIKICLNHQDENINNISATAILKDVLRYDMSKNMRFKVLKHININERVVSAILERALDSSIEIRKYFWEHMLHKIDLKQLDTGKRIFLLKRAFLEREFDASKYFYDAIGAYDLFTFIDMFYCNEAEYATVIRRFLDADDKKYKLDQFDHKYINFLYIYYKFIEETEGRDALELMDLFEFMELFYNRAKEINIENDDEISVLKTLFKCFELYDIFDDKSRKLLLKIIFKLFDKENVIYTTTIIEECVILINRICYNDKEKVFRGLIQILKDQNNCFVLCEMILKNSTNLCDEIKNAILEEIAMPNPKGCLNIFYYFLLQSNDPKNVEINNINILRLYIDQIPHPDVYKGLSDLVLSNKIEFNDVKHHFADEISNSLIFTDENTIIPVTKFLMAGCITDNINKYVENLLIVYYTTESVELQQYLACFMFEYFKNNCSRLIDVFIPVMCKIKSNNNIFIDQVLYWISNCRMRDQMYYDLFNIVIKHYNNENIDQNNKKLLITFDYLSIDNKWIKDRENDINECISNIDDTEIKEYVTQTMQLDK